MPESEMTIRTYGHSPMIRFEKDTPKSLTSLHMQTADDLFGEPQGSPRTDKLIAVSIQWAEKIVRKIDDRFS